MKDPYECPRCGYRTKDKAYMRKHLFKTKKPCQGCKSNVILTEEIKEYILLNRVWRHNDDTRDMKTYITNYNMVNNFVSNMSITNKLDMYLEHQNIKLKDFEESVEDIYKTRNDVLESKAFTSPIIKFKKEHFLEFVDEVSNLSSRLDQFNIMYDTRANKILLYESGAWQESLALQGMRQVIECIKAYYLDAYETYLLRNIKLQETSAIRKQECRNLLTEYYHFLVCFDIIPFVFNKSDGDIMETDLLSSEIEDEFFNHYQMINDKIMKGEIMSIQRQVIDIIKRNSSRNIEDLNLKLTELFRMDTKFKSMFGHDMLRL